MIDRRHVLAAAAAWVGIGAGKAPAPFPRDLTGTWTNAWYTWLERRKAFTSLVVTPAEAEAYEHPRRALHGELVDAHDELGQAETEFPDNGPGLARIRGEIRSSWIVDPADGKIPWTDAARARFRPKDDPPEHFDNVEERPTDERCLTAASGAAPILNSHDTNVVQLVLTPDALVIVAEKNHDARIVRIGAKPAPGEPRAWLGASTGHWEGSTLVVETTGLRAGITKLTDDLSLSDQSRVTERFTRTGPREITYLFAVTDPSLFTQTWRGEMVFRPAEGQIYEFACHEGNYSLPSILSAARQGNQPSPEPAKGK